MYAITQCPGFRPGRLFRRAAVRRFTALREFVILGGLFILAGPAAAQTVINPRFLEFRPSADHAAPQSDAGPSVERYEVEFYQSGASAPFLTIDLGKPAPDGDGIIRADLTSELGAFPLPGVTCESRVVAVGPGGKRHSSPSNPFVVDGCMFVLNSAGAAVPGIGGTGDVGIEAASKSCAWTATSSAAWLTISGETSGSGPATVAFSAAPNPSAAPRSATLTIAGYALTVSQGASVPATVAVSSEAQLQAALRDVAPGTEIVLAPGVYALKSTLRLDRRVTGLTIKGATGNASDVVLAGAGLTNEEHGARGSGLWVSGEVEGLTLANFTFRGFYRSGVRLDGGVSRARIANVRFVDAGRQMLLGATDSTGRGARAVIVEDSLFEYSRSAPEAGATALDVRGGRDWVVRRSTFRRIAGTGDIVAGPAVSASAGSANTVVEWSLFLNCQRSVAFGLENRTPADHTGGAIRNNFFYRAETVPGEAAITLAASPRTRIIHNSILLSGTYATPIEYRYAGSTGVVVQNNLLDGVVWARDGALGDDTVNDTSATASYFVNPAAGDLHLAPAARTAVDAAAPVGDVESDWDGHPRTEGAGADMGADEMAAQDTPR